MSNTGSLEKMRTYFQSGATLPAGFRKEQLKKLRQAIFSYEKELYGALYADLRKSPEECWVTELGLVVSEINVAIKNLESWMEPKRAGTNLLNLPSGSRIISEPLGVVLIIAPWNYPFHLLVNPLVGAIAAGNCAVLKPSEFAPATEEVMGKMFAAVFPPEYISYIRGEGQVVLPAMMDHFRFDHVFYTGSTQVGRIIYKMAADKLVPVTLELGGKSPCVIEEDADIRIAARRVGLTKFSNAGQMCVAPDYVLVHESKKEKFLSLLQEAIRKFYGDRAEESYNYGKIINEKQFDRISSYLKEGQIVYGGRTDKENLFISPTILTGIATDAKVMEDEIFGPVLPVIGYSDTAEAKTIIAKHPNPLAFYIFTSSRRKEKEWLDSVPFGGGCVNNASWHLTNHNLPFGGRGTSGTGAYHGKFSFETFSHKKAVMRTPTWFDPAIKYPPFKGKLNLFKRVIR
jgi:aldehyde dehydrogenase (NAD+)